MTKPAGRNQREAVRPGPDQYQPPRLRRLGSLAELTRSGDGPNEDGIAGNGDWGSL